MLRKRVLIVDDEEDLTWSISKHLAKDKDKYDIVAVNNAHEALKILKKDAVEVVVTDIRMPEISGLDLLLKIKKNYPDTKVIIMTAYGSSEVQDEANKRGCFKYIEKPFEIQQLRKMILDAVEERKGFEGRISDFQLSDIIQMNCLGRLTNALHVQKGNLNGVIFFEDGNIIHAALDGSEGEEAFYEIVSWEGGTFSVSKGQESSKETIFKGWQTLLLEGLRRADEKRNRKLFEEEQEFIQKREKISALLKSMLKAKGILVSALCDADGELIASVVQDEYETRFQLDKIIEQIRHLLGSLSKLAHELRLGREKELLFDFEDGLVNIIQIPRLDRILILITDKSINTGLLRMETKKCLKALLKII